MSMATINEAGERFADPDPRQLQDAVTLAADLHEGAQLEDAITQACTQLSLAPTRELQDVIFARIQLLHGMRTAEQVARLEELRGLRK